MPRLFLLDGTALAYRSHFAMARSGLTSPDGRPTGATYGFTMTLRKLMAAESPDLIAVAFDPPGPTFRHKRFKEYKATREKMPDDLVLALDDMRDVVRAHGIPIFEVPGFEADDVIGTLSTQAREKDWEVMLVTGDKDLMQLVDEKAQLYNVFKTKVDLVIQGIDEVHEKFGTTPDHVIDVLAIMGDSSDNIPGVKGIGEKGAIKLISEFGSVPTLIERLDEVKGKTKEKLETDLENLKLSLELVTIDREVPLDPGIESIAAPEPDDKRLQELFAKFGFQSLLRAVARPKKKEERDYHLVKTEKQLDQMIAELKKASSFAFDTETTSLDALQADLVGMSFSASPMRAFYVPCNLEPPILPGGKKALLERLRPLLTGPEFQRAGQNYKYDALVMAHNGLEMPAPDFDTMVASFCVSGASRGGHGLDELALTWFDLVKIPTKQLIGTGKSQITMDQVPLDELSEYACEDADVTWRLREAFEDELEKTGNQALFYELEMPLVPVLTNMEIRGIRLDPDVLEGMREELEADIQKHEFAAHECASRNFKVSSPKALGEVLFEEMRVQDAAGVKRPKRTKTGWSTDQATLTEKYGDVPIVKHVLAFREATKLKNTYVDALPEYINPDTGRIHCSFSQVAAATGRLASSDPNLQNIPVRTERGRRLREAFVARDPDEHGEWVLLAADYSQVELRVMAHLSRDPELIRAFAEGRDIHASTASIVFDVPEDEVDREMRSRSKAINFGLLYGMGASRLARETGLSIPEAVDFIERYFDSFPNVRGWIDATLDRVRETGYAETLLGRRRKIADINSDNGRIRSMAENAAVNTPVQGSAADIIKRAMIDLEERLTASPLNGEMLLQVHDELVLEIPKSELEATTDLVRDCMENAVTLDVPLQVDFGSGKNWLEAH